MRLFVSTVVAAVVLALWLPVTADFDYAVTIAENALPSKSYKNLVFASCAVAYSVAGLFQFSSGAKPAGPTTRKHDKPGPGQGHTAITVKGGAKRHQKKTAVKTKQRHPRAGATPCQAGAVVQHGMLAAPSCHATFLCTGVTAQAVAEAKANDAQNKRKKKSRQSLACEESISNMPWSPAGADAELLQGGHKLSQAADAAPVPAQQGDAGVDTSGGGFTLAPCWKRHSRLGKSLFNCLPTNAAAAAAVATTAGKELQPQGRLITIEEQLPGLARTLEYVPGEGDCQFCSVCMLVEGSWENHLQLRQRVCHHMAANEALFAPFVPSSSLASYLSDMVQPCSWGDELTLTAMADLLRRELRVVTDHHEGQQGVHAYAPLAGPTIEDPIYMWFRQGHYNPLVPQ